jgi:hypothetical protein
MPLPALQNISIGLNCCLVLTAFYGLGHYGIPQQVDTFVMLLFMLVAPCVNLTYIFLLRKPQGSPLPSSEPPHEIPSMPAREQIESYFIFKNEEQAGPYSERQLRGMITSNILSPSDLLWQEGMTDWKSIDQVLPCLPQSRIIPDKPLGMRWYKWWTYGNLPLSVAINLITIPLLEAQGIAINILISILAVCTIFGLHQKREWAWRLNWLMIFVAYIKGAISAGTPRLSEYFTPPSNEEMAVRVIMWLIIGGLVWLWPNIVYWRKRKHLFVDK